MIGGRAGCFRAARSQNLQMSNSEKYEFNLNDPSSWSKMPRPPLAPSFTEGLARINRAARDAGLVKGKDDLFRIVWGCDEEVYIDGFQTIPSGWYLKYQLCSVEKVKTVNSFPVVELQQIGEPRWIIEQYRHAGDYNGVFDQNGYYFLRRVQMDDEPENAETKMKPFREPDERDLVILAGIVQHLQTVTDAERRAGVERQKEKESAAKDKQKAEFREEMTESIIEGIKDAPKNIPFAPDPKDFKGAKRTVDILREQMAQGNKG